MKKTAFAITAILLLFCPLAQALDYKLSDEDVKSLAAPAQKEYQEGQEALDIIRYDLAMNHFLAAQQADPSSVAIRFLVAKLAVTEGRKRMGDEAIGLYRKAQTALEEITAMAGIGAKPSEVRRAQEGIDKVKDLIVKQAERDSQRVKLGKVIVRERAQEMYAADEKKKDTDEAAQNAQGAGVAAQPAGSPMMMRMPAR